MKTFTTRALALAIALGLVVGFFAGMTTTPQKAEAQVGGSAVGAGNYFRQLGSVVSTVVSSLKFAVGSTTPNAKMLVQGTSGSTDLVFNVASSTGASLFTVLASGNVGIGTTSPYALLSVGNTGGIGFTLATSTFNTTGGINLSAGCFAVNGVCVGGGAGSGTVTSIATTYPVTGGTITTSGTIGLAFGTTTSNTWGGTQTFTNNPILGSLTGLISGNTGTLYTSATTSLTVGTGLTSSGTLGSQVGGTASSISFAPIAANSLWVNQTGGSAVPTAVATSSLGLVPYTGATDAVNLGLNTLFIGAEEDEGSIKGIAATTIDTAGGGIGVAGGNGIGIGMGGYVDLQAGTGGATGEGGFARFSGGMGQGGANGGNVQFIGGSSLGGGNGGNIDFQTGTGSGAGINGSLRIRNGSSAIHTIFDTSLVLTTNKTFTFPNWTGNFLIASSTSLNVSASGNVGIGTSTPGTLLSLGNTGNNTINISATATSTFGSGLNIRTGCFAVNGTCVGVGSGSGTVTSVAMTVPTGLSISGNPITTSGTLALTLTSGYNIPLTSSTTNWNTFYDTPSNRITAGTNLSWSGNTLNATGGGTSAFEIATTSSIAVSQLSFFTQTGGRTTLGGVATTSVTCSGNTTCTAFTVIGASPITISSTGGGTGLSTTTPISGSNLLVYSSTGAGAAYGVATSSLSIGASLSNSGTLGSQIGGTASSLSLNLGNANTWTGQQTFNTSAPIFGTLSGLLQGNGASALTAITGTAGQFPYYSGTNTLLATSSIFLATSGNIGIGTTSPVSRLDVTNSATSSAAISLRDPLGNVSLELRAGTSTLSNTFVGLNAGRINTTGSNNTAIGVNALNANTTGSSNTAVGLQALFSNTTGTSNTANGLSALQSNTTGFNNTANGLQALVSNTTGSNNTANGLQALLSNTTGSNNTANGASALFSNTSGSRNTALGLDAGQDITTANNNTLIGWNTGRGITTGANNTILGANVTGLTSTTANNIILADGAGNRRLNIDASGNVGIGTTTPTWLLNPFSATAPQLSLSAGAGIAQWAFRNAGGNLYFATTTVAGTATSSPSAFTIIGSTGNIGIGTTTPASIFHVTSGLSATTTIDIGSLDVTSKSCFNARNTAGAATSFYFVGTTMVVEANRCK